MHRLDVGLQFPGVHQVTSMGLDWVLWGVRHINTLQDALVTSVVRVYKALHHTQA